ncbi:MAG: hypothetical protein LBF34_02090 [Puniceicoccales bacterium]|jgi:hypothetical protein|nr:hypothetical protein [Puniceicoccales bacterium]
MSRKLHVVLGLGLFSMELLGRPSAEVIEQVQTLENQIDSGELNSIKMVDAMMKLHNLALANFASLPELLKECLDGGDDAFKKSISYNFLRLYAFPDDPSKIGTVMDDLFFRTEEIAISDNNTKRSLLAVMANLDIDEHKQQRFQEIIRRQGADVLEKRNQ